MGILTMLFGATKNLEIQPFFHVTMISIVIAVMVMVLLSLMIWSNKKSKESSGIITSLEERYEKIRSIGQECIQGEELWELLKRKSHPIYYYGFEPSGRMHIAQDEFNRKIKKAYCPPKIVEGNPCLEYLKYIALPCFNEFTVERKAEYGGTKTYHTVEELASDYELEALHPGDLKPALAKALNMILQPVRDYFSNGEAKKLLELVKGYSVTR